MKEVNDQVYNRLQEEAKQNVSQFAKSTYGKPLCDFIEEENILELIQGFTGIAYAVHGRTPKRWTRQVTSEIIGFDFRSSFQMGADGAGIVGPVFVNYMIFLDKELHYLNNSSALVKGVIDGTMMLDDDDYDVPDFVDEIPDETVAALKGEAGQKMLQQAPPEEVAMMKEQYASLKELDAMDVLDSNDKKMLDILTGLFGSNDHQPKMTLRKKK